MNFSVRIFNLSLVTITIIAVCSIDLNLLLIAIPLALFGIFDGGRANAIDAAHRNIKHLYSKSEDAKWAIYFLGIQNMRLAQIKIMGLKCSYPEDQKVNTALDAINEYDNRRKWWSLK